MAEVNREDRIKEIQQATGEDRTTAEFIYAIEAGEIEGDALNQDGKDPDEDARLDNRNG